MKYKILPPTSINTTINLPPSKSMSNRALILNALSFSNIQNINLSNCEDTQVIIDAFNCKQNVIDVKDAGSAMRFLTAFLAGMDGEWIIKGSQRMHQRPIYPLVDSLCAVGADIEYLNKKGFPPLKIRGKRLKGGKIYLAGNISSQFVSALLMVAPIMKDKLILHVEDRIVSESYVNLTISMMKMYGAEVTKSGNNYIIYPQHYKPAHIVIEPDWTSASYWYEIVSLLPNSTVKLPGLTRHDLQGDSKATTLFEDLSVSSTFLPDGLLLTNTGQLKTKKLFHDFLNQLDLVQTFAVTCCLHEIPFLFAGLSNLKIKETDRIAATINELHKLGYIVTEPERGLLEWQGEHCIAETNTTIQTYSDHRMAMSFTPACLKFQSITIEDPKVVRKSYPGFWDDIKKAGFTIEPINN